MRDRSCYDATLVSEITSIVKFPAPVAGGLARHSAFFSTVRIAAIDIGTNSVHMIVVQVRPDHSFEIASTARRRWSVWARAAWAGAP